MKVPAMLTHSSQNELGFLKESAFLEALPEGFKFRSSAYKVFDFNPSISVDTLIGKIKGFIEVYRSSAYHHGTTVTCMSDDKGQILYLEFSAARVTIQVYSSDHRADHHVSEILLGIKEFEFKNTSEEGVWARFSYYTSDGPRTTSQFLKCPTWDKIRDNYPRPGKIDWLMALEDPKKYGHLVIWHGPPGTGKTYAIRALMMAWKERFNFVIVTDPENLSSKSEYYYGVCGDSEDESPLDKKKKTLFIMEDAADLIIEESRNLHYDKIGKLLNMTDGLLGQGREDVFVVTFNEKITKIDQAFVRPGRCIMTHKFDRFEKSEAEKWAKIHKGKIDFRKDDPTISIAEMYASLLGVKRQEVLAPEVRFGLNG